MAGILTLDELAVEHLETPAERCIHRQARQCNVRPETIAAGNYASAG